MSVIKKYIAPIDTSTLRRKGANSLFVGSIAGKSSKAFLDINSLSKHLMLIGSTGAGKTTASMIIAEECMMHNIAVLVMDISNKWSNFKEKCTSESMLSAYRRFGMESPRSFDVSEVLVTGDDKPIKMSDFIESGKLGFFNLGKLDQKQFNTFICKTMKELISISRKGANNPRALVIIDDAYKLSPVFGGSATPMLEDARSSLWCSGISLMIITHSFIDFEPFGFGTVGTEICFRTPLEEDIERAKSRYGSMYASCLPEIRTGEAMVSNIDFNYGRPWFIKFRPLYHKQ